jgi:hypothetical protein
LLVEEESICLLGYVFAVFVLQSLVLLFVYTTKYSQIPSGPRIAGESSLGVD